MYKLKNTILKYFISDSPEPSISSKASEITGLQVSYKYYKNSLTFFLLFYRLLVVTKYVESLAEKNFPF